MNQHTETQETNERTYAESEQFEPSAPQSASDRGLTTADIASGRQSPEREPTEEHVVNLLPEERLSSLKEQWSTIQTSFVDEPKSSVEKADELVADVMQTIAKRFAEERDTLEREWSGGGDPSTEDLRRAMQHYRSFFERLLAA